MSYGLCGVVTADYVPFRFQVYFEDIGLSAKTQRVILRSPLVSGESPEIRLHWWPL